MHMASLPVIETVHDALVLPPTRRNEDAAIPSAYVFDGGVYDAARHPVALAQHVGGGGRNLTPVEMAIDVTPVREAGRWVFGGWLRGHFGHFIEESLGRLWAIREVEGPITGIVFLLWGGWEGQAEKRAVIAADQWFVREALALLGIPHPIRIVTEPSAFETLIVPQQLHLHHSASDASGWRTQKAFLGSMIARPPRGAEVMPRRIYVSRARLAPDKARFVLENVIEDSLRKSNYVIVHPETLTLGEQAALYAGAKQVIFAEGSSVHFAAPFCGPRTKVVVLARRWPLKIKFARQLSTMGCARVHLIGEKRGSVHMVAGHEQAVATVADNVADVLLDFEKLGDRLAALGFMNRRHWTVPSDDAVRAAIDGAIAAKAQAMGGIEHDFFEEYESQVVDFIPKPTPLKGVPKKPR